MAVLKNHVILRAEVAMLFVGLLGCPGGRSPDGPPANLVASDDSGTQADAVTPGDSGAPVSAGELDGAATDGAPPAPTPSFTDVTTGAGLPPLGDQCMAFEDFDGDGRPDLLLESQSQLGVRSLDLYINAGDGSFRAVSVPHQFSLRPGGCSAGDLDNDGLVDMAVVTRDAMRAHVFQNLGGGIFQESATLSEPQPDGGPARGFGAVGFADFDGDGLLDVLVTPWQAAASEPVSCRPSSDEFCSRPGTRCAPPPVIFRNTGGWTFAPPVSVASTSDCGPANGHAIGITDYNGDGRPDFFIANDYGVDAFYVQSPTAFQFTDIAPMLSLRGRNNGMGVAFEDYNLDGNLDFYVSDVSSDQFYLGTDGGAVASHAADWGVAAATQFHSGWAPIGEDFDSDGFADIWVVNAALLKSYAELSQIVSGNLAPIQQSDFLFHNRDGFGFDAMLFRQPFRAQPGCCTGASATADYDGDGELDIVEVVGNPARLRLLHNGVSGANWLNVRLVGHRSNRDGLGARLTLKQSGRPDVSKFVQRTRGSIGASWSTVHFGLASRTDIDELDVRWPSGVQQAVSAPISVDRLLVLDEP